MSNPLVRLLVLLLLFLCVAGFGLGTLCAGICASSSDFGPQAQWFLVALLCGLATVGCAVLIKKMLAAHDRRRLAAEAEARARARARAQDDTRPPQ